MTKGKYLIIADIRGQQREFSFKQRNMAEMEYRRYCGMSGTFSADLWFMPASEDKEPHILDSWERK